MLLHRKKTPATRCGLESAYREYINLRMLPLLLTYQPPAKHHQKVMIENLCSAFCPSKHSRRYVKVASLPNFIIIKKPCGGIISDL